jgi:hypothetical protein
MKGSDMADTREPENQAETFEDYVPGTVDDKTHGWAPDAPGTGESKQRVVEANKKAFEAQDTQDEATGEGEAAQGPDLTGGHVGESITRRGEDVVNDEGKEPGRHDGPPQGESQRPTGSSTARGSTGVDPQEPIDDESPFLQPGG